MKINGKFYLRKMLGENILIRMDGAKDVPEGVYVLDDVGSFLWEHIEGAADAEELAKLLTEEYEIDYGTAFADVCEFLGKLTSGGLL